MNDPAEWYVTEERGQPEGHGKFVRCGSKLGYAKSNQYIYREKLAADLAKLVRVPVPSVVLADVPTLGLCSVSHMRNFRSHPLANKGYTTAQPPLPPNSVLSMASRLLPFIAWIGDDDHFDDTNFVVEYLRCGAVRVVAIDFENAFRFQTAPTAIEKIDLGFNNHLFKNRDDRRVKRTVNAINGLTRKQVIDCCTAVWRDCGADAAEWLLSRRDSLESALRRERWFA